MTRQAILDAAIAFVDEHGIEALTVRKLGETLGSDPTAFYRHYRNKADLVTAIADRLLTDMLADFTPHEHWRDTIIDLMHRARQGYLDHSNFSQELSVSPDILLSNALVNEEVLRALLVAGLPAPQVSRFAVMIARWTIAVSSRDAALRQSGETETTLLASKIAFANLPKDRFPLATQYAAELFPEPDDAFMDGLNVILDAIEHAAAQADPSDS
jgi:AcrR family transcriptional regulator